MDWLHGITVQNLISYAGYLMIVDSAEDGKSFDIELMASHMCEGGPRIWASASPPPPPEEDGRPPKSVWESVKIEMIEFLCGRSRTYRQLRIQLRDLGKGAQKLVVPTISAFIASKISVEAGLVSGFVALILGVFLKTGHTGFCNFYYAERTGN